MDGTTQPPAKQHLVVLAGVVGSGKSTLSSAWERLVPGWIRVNQDDLGDRRACEQAVRAALRNGLSVLVDRQNFDAQQRRTWLEIATEFPAVDVGGMVMGTSKEECRQRLLVRHDHPTIDNPRLAVDLLDKFSGLWEEPRLDEGYDHLLTLPALPPASLLTPALLLSLLAALLASPRNPNAAAQRQPRPRAPSGTYARAGAGPGARPFVDDGTWRSPRARAPGPPLPPHQQQPYYPQQQQQQQQPAPHLSAFPPGAGYGHGHGHGGAWSVPAHTHAQQQQGQAQGWGSPAVPHAAQAQAQVQVQVQDVEERRRAAGAAAQARADAATARRAQLDQAQVQGGDVSSAAQGGAGGGGAGWAPPSPQGPSGAGFEVR